MRRGGQWGGRTYYAPRQPTGSKAFAIDWERLIEWLVVWDALAPRSREFLAAMKSSSAVRPAEFGADVARLERARILDITQNRTTARLHREAYVFTTFLRALGRHDLLARSDAAALTAYIHDHFTNDERSQLAGAFWDVSGRNIATKTGSIGWVRGFLDSPPEHLRDAERAAAVALVRWFVEHPEPVALRALPALISDVDGFAGGLAACVGRLLLFPAFRGEDLEVVIGLWPPIAERLRNGNPAPPAPFTAEKTFEGAYLIDDMTAVLIAASAAPLRVRQADGQIFERTQTTLAEGLARLPDWLGKENWFAPDMRIEQACTMLEALGLLVRTPKELRPDRNAPAWLALEAKERLRTVLDQIRLVDDVPQKTRGHVATHHPDDDEDFFDLDDDDLFDPDDDDPYEQGRRRPDVRLIPRGAFAWRQESATQLRAAVRSACAALAREDFVPIGAFLEYEGRCRNPLLSDALLRGAWRAYRGESTDEELEYQWPVLLGDLFYERLLPLGGGAIGTTDGKAGIRLTSVGRYLLGLSADFEYAAVATQGTGTIVVQPNFDVVFTAPSPREEAAIARFAERTGHSVGTLFRITRQSVFAAAGAGVRVEDALETLEAAASRPVPANVRREVEGWFHICRRIALEPAVLLRCPDAETASRVLGAAGRAARRVSDTVLELADDKARTRIIRKLQAEGIFVDDRTPPRRTGRHRRYR
jgi:hypothetical protein